jgi:NAD-dependent dihydropyrimidine dehydrogenase PreA subunit
MCDFCQEHGEGKKWYLQVKNYARELLNEELTEDQQAIVGVKTRRVWMQQFFSEFVSPPTDSGNQTQASPRPTLSENEVVHRRQVEHFGQALPIEDVEQVINLVDVITRYPCGCRYVTTGKSDKRYCFGVALDPKGTFQQNLDPSLEVLDKKEAMKILNKYDKEGLMHSIWTGVTPYVIGICNCDHDCLAYRHYIEKDGYPTFFRAEYVASVNWDLCKGCKKCMQQCQFAAMFYSSTNTKVYIEPTKCFGCGVCRTACSKNAITLIPREQNKEAANIWLKRPA